MTQPTKAAELPDALALAKEYRVTMQAGVLHPWAADARDMIRRLHAENEALQRELVKESHRTAEQKLRADQMTEQHRHQAALNREARAELADMHAQVEALSAAQAGVPADDIILAAARNWGDVQPYMSANGSGEQLYRVTFHVHQRAAHFAKELVAAVPQPSPSPAPAQPPHVQNPAEIEHVAGDVSKTGAEVNTNVYAELPPRYYLAGGVEKTWDQQQMCVFADATHALRAQQPAPVRDYPQLPRVGPIGYASVVDIDSYVTRLTIGPHLVGVRDVALWTTDQMRAYADETYALRIGAKHA